MSLPLNLPVNLPINLLVKAASCSSTQRYFWLKLIGVFCLITGLSGCGPIITFGDGEPETVYTLHYKGAGNAQKNGPVVFVSEPAFSQGLGGQTFIVKLSEYERTAIKNVRWSAGTDTLLRDYLVASLRDSTPAITLGEDGLDITATCRLNSFVWDMDFIPGSKPQQDRVELRIEFSLINLVTGILVDSQTYHSVQSVTGNGAGIAAGFNQATADISKNAGLWLTGNKDLSPLKQCL